MPTAKDPVSLHAAASQTKVAVRLCFGISCIGVSGYIATNTLLGTGALRTLFLLLIVGGMVCYTWMERPALTRPSMDLAGRTLWLLTAWLIFQTVFLAVDGSETLKTLGEEWAKNLLVAAFGIWLARAALFAGFAKWVYVAVFLGFFVHVLGTIGYQGWQLLTKGNIVFTRSLFGHYGHIAQFVDCVIAIALADTTSRVCFSRPLMNVSAAWLAGIFFLSGLSLAALAAKASWLVVVLLVGMFAVIAAFKRPQFRSRILAVSIMVALGVSTVGALVHGRWDGAMESIRYGQAVEEHTVWMGTGEPLPDHINESFYLRAAWGVVGFRGLAEHPLGRGYGSNAFGRYLQERYGIVGAVSSHSGWLDFALANGVPGLVLLLAFSWALCLRSWRAFLQNSGIGGLTLAFLTVAYISRCLIDGHFTSSRLMGFALVSGVLWGLIRDIPTVHESDPA